MDKNAIKKYAVWARLELLSRVKRRALQYGISEEDIGDPSADTVNGHLLTAAEKKQRQALIAKIAKDGRAAHPANAGKCMQDNENEKEKEKEQDQEKEQEESRRRCANGNFSAIQEYVSGNLGHLSDGNLRELAQYAEKLPEALIFCAVDECCAADKRRFSYLKSILRAYVQEGIQTVEAAKERSERFQAARTSGKNPALNYAQRSYAEEDFSTFFEDLG